LRGKVSENCIIRRAKWGSAARVVQIGCTLYCLFWTKRATRSWLSALSQPLQRAGCGGPLHTCRVNCCLARRGAAPRPPWLYGHARGHCHVCSTIAHPPSGGQHRPSWHAIRQCPCVPLSTGGSRSMPPLIPWIKYLKRQFPILILTLRLDTQAAHGK
jgi:hypothetical protein